ncbi:type II secretion system inner membrane protein GspF [Kordiimonas aquimaris]|uniref:type II secretion system inner membrane protein GspF n=1 Tax=Kordiimonas aquimaris TaxID=707591 RepID=UPI0021D23997|nr:type II secretion system inner membrane protein GspF [Kordiimonas aquimaris]
MPAYEYQALDARGRNRKGIISADSERDARQQLKASALFATAMVPAKASIASRSKLFDFANKLSAKDLVLITRQLSTMLEAATPLEEALNIIATEAEKPVIRCVLTRVRTSVIEGTRLSAALEQETQSFDPLYCAMVGAGEASGNLAGVLSNVADQREKTEETKRKVQTAMIYPMVLAFVAIAVVTVMMIFVVPRVVEQFANFGGELPTLTIAVIAVSNFLTSYGGSLAVVLLLVIVGFVLGMQQAGFRLSVHTLLLKLPVIGGLLRTVNAARFARALGTLINGGSPVLEGLYAARATLLNKRMQASLDTAIAEVREGGSLSQTLRRSGQFPAMLSYMIAAGERSGQLAEMLTKVADYLDRDFDGFTKTALGLLEPLIVIFMGVVVGAIVISIMLPILQLNQLVLA